ncbi:putative ATP/GTP-binding protein [Escherichia coli]|uniref:Putative ATP/GTP-binding protein n=1 Tax=Escherichia coli TaxID=562 RepID=A0A376LBY3_ECOLX|nr:putative ATP/GTP-binding protein [Escherichia coli]
MLRVHEELTALQGQTDPLEIIADRFKAETDVLCFDEFFVSDITDAMLLGGLMKAPVRPRYYPGSDVKYSAGRTLSKWPTTWRVFCLQSMPLNSIVM